MATKSEFSPAETAFIADHLRKEKGLVDMPDDEGVIRAVYDTDYAKDMPDFAAFKRSVHDVALQQFRALPNATEVTAPKMSGLEKFGRGVGEFAKTIGEDIIGVPVGLAKMTGADIKTAMEPSKYPAGSTFEQQKAQLMQEREEAQAPGLARFARGAAFAGSWNPAVKVGELAEKAAFGTVLEAASPTFAKMVGRGAVSGAAGGAAGGGEYEAIKQAFEPENTPMEEIKAAVRGTVYGAVGGLVLGSGFGFAAGALSHIPGWLLKRSVRSAPGGANLPGDAADAVTAKVNAETVMDAEMRKALGLPEPPKAGPIDYGALMEAQTSLDVADRLANNWKAPGWEPVPQGTNTGPAAQHGQFPDQPIVDWTQQHEPPPPAHDIPGYGEMYPHEPRPTTPKDITDENAMRLGTTEVPQPGVVRDPENAQQAEYMRRLQEMGVLDTTPRTVVDLGEGKRPLLPGPPQANPPGDIHVGALQRKIERLNTGGVQIETMQVGDELHIVSIKSDKPVTVGRVMKQITKLADEYGVALTGEARPLAGGEVSELDLAGLYRKLGAEPVGGEGSPFMRREPKGGKAPANEAQAFKKAHPDLYEAVRKGRLSPGEAVLKGLGQGGDIEERSLEIMTRSLRQELRKEKGRGVKATAPESAVEAVLPEPTPTRLYHGSSNIKRQGGMVGGELRSDVTHSGKPREDRGIDALGVWFSPSKADAAHIGRAHDIEGGIYGADVTVKKPLTFNSSEEYMAWAQEQVKSGKYDNPNDPFPPQLANLKASALRADLEAQGYDSIVIKGGGKGDRSPEGADYVLVFDPKAAKNVAEEPPVLSSLAERRAALKAREELPKHERAMSAINDITEYMNPLNPKERILGNTAIDIYPTHDDRLHLSSLRSFATKQGHGTETMRKLIKIADEHGIELELDPVPLKTTEQIPKGKLIDWYRTFGFKFKDGTMVRAVGGGVPEAKPSLKITDVKPLEAGDATIATGKQEAPLTGNAPYQPTPIPKGLTREERTLAQGYMDQSRTTRLYHGRTTNWLEELRGRYPDLAAKIDARLSGAATEGEFHVVTYDPSAKGYYSPSASVKSFKTEEAAHRFVRLSNEKRGTNYEVVPGHRFR